MLTSVRLSLLFWSVLSSPKRYGSPSVIGRRRKTIASRSSHRLSRNAINVEVAIPMASASVAGSPQGSCSVRPYARATSVLSPEPRRYSSTSNVKSKAGRYARWPSGSARYLAT